MANNEIKKIKIKLPLTKSEKDDVYVAVNGKSYLIKRGETVEVPDFVVKELERSEAALQEAIAFADEAAARSEQ